MDSNDAEILYPDQALEIDGQRLVVREFRYREGLEIMGLARPFLSGLNGLMESGVVSPEDLDGLIAEHRDIWLTMVARSCGRDFDWVAALPDRSAMELQMAFWGANSGFFTRRLLFRAALAAGLDRKPSASRKSSPRSSPPGSDATSTISANA